MCLCLFEVINKNAISTFLKLLFIGLFRIKIEENVKVKKLGNREETRRWDVSEKVTISSEGLQAKINRCKENIIARPGFPISVEHCPKDDSLWTIYYYEVTQVSQYGFAAWIGLSNGDTSSYLSVANGSNAYCVPRGCDFYINSGKSHDFEWKDGATKPEWKGPGDVVGCGVLLQSENKVSIFFTLNGQLLGREIPIKNEDGDQLFPSVTIWDMTLEANFGNDPAKPFKYDTTNCPGLELKAK